MKNLFKDYIRKKYKKDPYAFLSLVFLFVLSPIALFYMFGLTKGALVFLSLWVVLGVIPYIYHSLVSLKFDSTDLILLGAVGICLVWIVCIYLYFDSFEYALFATCIGILFYIIIRIANWIGLYKK